MATISSNWTIDQVNDLYNKKNERWNSLFTSVPSSERERMNSLFETVVAARIAVAEDGDRVTHGTVDGSTLADAEKKAVLFAAMDAYESELSGYQEQLSAYESSGWKRSLRVIKSVAAAILFLVGIAAIGVGVVSLLSGAGVLHGSVLAALGMGALAGSAAIGVGAGAIAAGLFSSIGGGVLIRSLLRPDTVVNCVNADHHLLAQKMATMHSTINSLEDTEEKKEFSTSWKALNQEWVDKEQAARAKGAKSFEVSYGFMQRLSDLEKKISALSGSSDKV